MSNPAKRKGTEHETAIVNYLASQDIRAWRVAQTGFNDSGDIHGEFPFVIQAKSYADLATALRLGVDGANKQKLVAGTPFGVAVIKRPRKPVSAAYAVMDLETFASVLKRLR